MYIKTNLSVNQKKHFENMFISDKIDLDTSKNEEIVKKICKYNTVVGDGICDDNANVFECDFDGGDCCGIGTIMDMCLKCQCFSK